ncbi:MAG: methyltransferase RsmF C-terminal domain-like protein, partial [Bacteroidota bacterium]
VLTENLVKWGSAHTIVTNNDPSHFRQLPEFFDLMLVDAPCSGSGLFRKDPTVIETWQPEQVELCNRRQQRILADVLPALREGGYLIYATCSFSPEEDEDITRWLIDEMDMESVPIPVVADWGIVEGSTPGTFRFFPDKLQGEGFYASVLRKKRSDGYTPFREVLPEAVGQQMAQHFRSLFHLTTADHLFFQSGAVRLIPEQHFQSLSQLAGSLYIKKAGVALGEQKGKDIVPSHEWAMLQGKKEGWPMVQVDREQALSFLARQTFELPLDKGWSLLTYKNSVLGWVKNAGSRLNNYYPADWRIRRLVNG